MERNREFGIGERVIVNEKAPGGYVGKSATVREVILDSRYGIAFDNHKGPITYLESECLSPLGKI